MSKLISVIVPVYNVEKYLNRCVDSILNQTYTNLEVILVDDGSPDSCPAICDEYAKKDKRVKVIHKANAGVSAARNDGIQLAQGEFVVFVDSDDWIDSTMYEKMLAKQQETNADLVFCKFNQVFDIEVNHIEEKQLSNLCADNVLPLFSQDMIIADGDTKIHTNNVMGTVCRILFAKHIIKQLRFDTSIAIEEDLLLVSQAVNKSKKCAVVDEYLYNYYFRTTSAVNKLSQAKLDKACNFANALTKCKIVDESLIKSVKFNEFAFYYMQCIKANQKLTNKELLAWNTHANYKQHKKNEYGFKTKLKYFLIRIKAKLVLRLLYKIRKNK